MKIDSPAITEPADEEAESCLEPASLPEAWKAPMSQNKFDLAMTANHPSRSSSTAEFGLVHTQISRKTNYSKLRF